MLRHKVLRNFTNIVTGVSVFSGVGAAALIVGMPNAQAAIINYIETTDAPSSSPGQFVGSIAPNIEPDDNNVLNIFGSLDARQLVRSSLRDLKDWYKFTLTEDAAIGGISFSSTYLLSDPIVQLQFYEETGTPLAISSILSLEIGQNGLPDAKAVSLERLFTAGTYYFQVFTNSILSGNNRPSYQIGIEFSAPSDIVITQDPADVPEPTSIVGLLVIGGLGCATRSGLGFISKLKKQK